MCSDIFTRFGICDITSDVNFTYLLKLVKFFGFTCVLFTYFSYFLISCGLCYILRKMFLNYSYHYGITKEVNTLILPTEMGNVFKIVILGKKIFINFNQYLISKNSFV